MFGATVDRDFTRNFLISCGAHALLVAIAFLGGSFIMRVFNVNDEVEIIRSSVRVDVVGMPKFTVKELKAMQAEAVPKPEPIEVQGTKTEAKTESEDVIKKGDLVIEEKAPKKKPSFMNLVSDYSNKKVAPKEKKKGGSESDHYIEVYNY